MAEWIEFKLKPRNFPYNQTRKASLRVDGSAFILPIPLRGPRPAARHSALPRPAGPEGSHTFAKDADHVCNEIWRKNIDGFQEAA